jgi:AcrR family transcriptional regulator
MTRHPKQKATPPRLKAAQPATDAPASKAHRGSGEARVEPRQRISGAEREALIVSEAVKFFAEFGFAGDTRELARRVDVTHPLLYKYFSTKEALIERVYEVVYLERWNPAWAGLIADHSMPLRERMLRFYTAFADVILSREWVRLFMFFGLRGADINERWFSVVRERVVMPFCAELRADLGLPSLDEVAATSAEIELIQGISSRIFSFGIRMHIYGMPLHGHDDVETLIKAEIDVFFDGIAGTLAKLIERQATSTARANRSRSQGRSRGATGQSGAASPVRAQVEA